MDTASYLPVVSEGTLVVIEGDLVQCWPLESRGRWTIGRTTPKNVPDIPLRSPIAGRKHGVLEWADGRWRYTDGGSLNGTFWNGVHLSGEESGREASVFLKNGDVLRIDYSDLNRPDRRGVLMLFFTDSVGHTWTCCSLEGRERVRIGRKETCDIVLPLPYVSACHGEITEREGIYYLSDCGSLAGTWLNGKRVEQPVRLWEKDRISICDCHFIFTENGLLYEARNGEPAGRASGDDVILQAAIREKTVWDQRGRGKKALIRDVKLEIRRGCLTALLGGSGAGKTTVMNCLNGMDQSGVDGQVLYRGEDLYREFERLKCLIGSVPQDNVVHEMLTVEQELRDAALLRLPKDTEAREIQRQVRDTLEALNLTQKRKTSIRKLSGGERKRVNIGVELVADREFLCLDEPDAGLDPLAKKELFLTLRKLAHEKGKSILVIIHDVSEIDLFDQIIMMAKVDGVGRLAFSGSPAHAREYFGVKDLSESYAVISRDPAQYIRG